MDHRPVPAPRTRLSANAGNQPQSALTSPVSNSPSMPEPSNVRPRPPVPPKKIQVVKDSSQLHTDISAISISDSCTTIAMAAGQKSIPSPVSPSKGEHPLKGFNYLAPLPSHGIQYTKDTDMKVTQDPGAKSGLHIKKYPDPDNDNSSVNKKSHNQEGPYSMAWNYLMGNDELMQWWSSVKPWDELTNDHLLSKDIEARTFTKKVQRIQMSLRVYDVLLTDRGESLQNHITELRTLADNIDKVSKKVKIAAITGAAGAVGGVAAVAAVAGIVLSPITLGASLAVTAAAVGVGVAATGAATGASAAIASKVTNTQDRKKVEKILQDYTSEMGDIERCLAFVQTETEHLRRHDLSTLKGVDAEAVTVAKIMEVAGGSSGALGATNRSAGIIEGFATGMELLFTKGDDQKLKKGKESKFAKKIRTVADQLQSQLEECFRFKHVLEERRYSLPTVNKDMK